MFEINIIKAKREHVSEICKVMKIVHKNLNDPKYFLADDEAVIKRHLDKDGFTLLAMYNNEVIGFLMVRFPGFEEDNLGFDLDFSEEEIASVVHMESIAVLPQFRGFKIQKKLIMEAEKILYEDNYKYLMATVYPENKASLHNFMSLGYEIAMTKKKYGGIERHILLKTCK